MFSFPAPILLDFYTIQHVVRHLTALCSKSQIRWWIRIEFQVV